MFSQSEIQAIREFEVDALESTAIRQSTFERTIVVTSRGKSSCVRIDRWPTGLRVPMVELLPISLLLKLKDYGR